MNELQERYLNWIADLVNCNDRQFLDRLYSIDYCYLKSMDGNRWIDGVDLRFRFGHENGIKDAEVCKYLDLHPCSFLEMTTALALKLEENIMYNPVEGPRTGLWFWTMMESLDISKADNIRQLEDKIDRFESGEVSLFKGMSPNDDAWYQGVRYLDKHYRQSLLTDLNIEQE